MKTFFIACALFCLMLAVTLIDDVRDGSYAAIMVFAWLNIATGVCIAFFYATLMSERS